VHTLEVPLDQETDQFGSLMLAVQAMKLASQDVLTTVRRLALNQAIRQTLVLNALVRVQHFIFIFL